MKRGPTDHVARRLSSLVRQATGPNEGATRQLQTLVDALASPEAPTGVQEPGRIVEAHVADSLAGLRVDALDRATTMADLGSGAGLPGLVLAAVRPSMRVYAVESNGRKAGFIASTAERMGLTNVEVVALRAEDWSEGAGVCDVVCARAVAAMPVLVEYAAPLLRTDGLLIAWKGAVEPSEVVAGAFAAGVVGLRPEPMVSVRPFPGATNHTLHIYRKVEPTPGRFPRRAGMAVKRPLTAPKLHQNTPGPRI